MKTGIELLGSDCIDALPQYRKWLDLIAVRARSEARDTISREIRESGSRSPVRSQCYEMAAFVDGIEVNK